MEGSRVSLVCVAWSNYFSEFERTVSPDGLFFRASLMIRGAEWACQGLSEAWATRKRIAQEPSPVDGFAIRAYSELFLSGGFCASWEGPVEKCEGSLEFWDAPGGGREKDNRKRKDSRKEKIIISHDFQDSPGYEDPGWPVT